MYCSKCGKELLDDEKYCISCGMSAEDNSVNQKYGGFWLRAVAMLVDVIVFYLFFLLMLWMLISSSESTLETISEFTEGGRYEFVTNIIAIIIGWLYFALLESSSWQATIGKRACGLKVADYEGNRISFARATGRYFASYISGIILLAGYIMAGFTEKKQALHDMIAQTLVIRD